MSGGGVCAGSRTSGFYGKHSRTVLVVKPVKRAGEKPMVERDMSNRLRILYEAARGLILVTVTLTGGVDALVLEGVRMMAGTFLA